MFKNAVTVIRNGISHFHLICLLTFITHQRSRHVILFSTVLLFIFIICYECNEIIARVMFIKFIGHVQKKEEIHAVFRAEK